LTCGEKAHREDAKDAKNIEVGPDGKRPATEAQRTLCGVAKLQGV